MAENLPNELSARLKFSEVVKRLDKISTTSNTEQKKTILSQFFRAIIGLQKKFRDTEGREANASFYPFLRLFIPKLDTERGAYGIQNKRLGQLFVNALALNPRSDDAKKLTNLQGNAEEYGDVVFDVMKTRSPENGKLTVYEVNLYLDMIAEHFKRSQQRKIENETARMLLQMSALEVKWLTRILLKKLKLNLGEKYILGQYHPKAVDLYNQNSHLSDLCELVDSGEPLDNVHGGFIEVFKPIRSMLCERGYIKNIKQLLDANVYYLETKMDGERCQLHVKGTEFKYFSRACKEDGLTQIFGANSTTGLYSPFLYHQLNGKVRNAIFDGEMMVWDKETETFLKKAENHHAKHLKKDDPRRIPCFVIYDLIYVDDESLIDKPYAERIRKLKTIVKEQKGALMLCNRTEVKSADHFLELLNKAFDSNEEGVVLKREDSKYRPGQREGGGWLKMKPDYENNLISDFDLLIIGGYYNDNRTAVDSFLLAVFKKNSPDSDSGVFHAVCKIRNGLSQSKFREILDKLEPFRHEITNRYQECPPGIEWANANPDFWVEPQKSIVLQIKASELTKTTTYRTSHSFRFPRVLEIRYDKMWYDTCSLNEFQTFCSSDSVVEKITKRHATADDLTAGTTVPKRQRGAAPKTSVSVAYTSNGTEAVDNVCHGLEFCILNGEKQFEDMVKRHGGKIVAYPKSSTFVIIAPNPTSINAKKHINSKTHNIAKKEWLIRALGSDKPLTELIKFTPDDMVYATEALQEQFDAEADNDDYFETPPMNFDNLPNDQADVNDEPNEEQDVIDIFDVVHAQTVSGEVTPDQIQPEVAEPMDEDNIDNQPVVEPVVLIDEPQGMDQNDESQRMDQEIVQVNDSVYEYDTQPIEPVTDDQLVNISNETRADNGLNVTTEVAEPVEDGERDDKNIFRSCYGYFYKEESSKSDFDITYAECMFMGRGGVCLETPEDIEQSSSRLTHIFVASDDIDRTKLKETVKSFRTEKIENIVVLRYQWVLDCHDQSRRICDTSYKVDL